MNTEINLNVMKKIYSIVLAVILLYGCDSFLDVKPKGKLLPEKVSILMERNIRCMVLPVIRTGGAWGVR